VFKTSAEEKKPTTVEVVRQRLRKVINPLTGLNVVRTNLVQDIKVKDGTVRGACRFISRSPVCSQHQGRNTGEDRDLMGR
jgi:metal-sulfur cluster biosynthetic enzyme